jgi:hypothetical protein
MRPMRAKLARDLQGEWAPVVRQARLQQRIRRQPPSAHEPPRQDSESRMLPEALQKASPEQVALGLGQPQLVQRLQKPG